LEGACRSRWMGGMGAGILRVVKALGMFPGRPGTSGLGGEGPIGEEEDLGKRTRQRRLSGSAGPGAGAIRVRHAKSELCRG
jgi:hypothetical protein